MFPTVKILSESEILERIQQQKNLFFKDYLLCYNSWLGGVTRQPHWMMVPMDEHWVTRGDAIFEAFRASDFEIYLLDQHMARLKKSAQAIELKPPMDFEDIQHLLVYLVREAGEPEVMIRLFLTRGPGSFSVNPYDSVGAQLYIIITRFHPLSEEKYQEGVSVGLSLRASKPSWLAQIKSCNYLPNALMRKEGVDKKFDYMLGLDPLGYLAEGATENFMMIDAEGVLTYPKPEFILQGTVMNRLCELAQVQGMKVCSRDIHPKELFQAQGVFLIGTSFGLLPVRQFENQVLFSTCPSVLKNLMDWLQKDKKR